jgi:hypothetical protein
MIKMIPEQVLYDMVSKPNLAQGLSPMTSTLLMPGIETRKGILMDSQTLKNISTGW